jgi:hypothetical protein
MVRNGHNVFFNMVRNGHMCQSAYGRKWSYIVSICIWYEMVIMCRSAYGTKGVAYVEASVKKYMQKKI